MEVLNEIISNSHFVTPILHHKNQLVNYGWQFEGDIDWLLQRKTKGLVGVWKPKGHPQVFKPEAAKLLKDIANVNK